MEYPYSDENLIYDEIKGRYYLTEQALLNEGVDMRGRISTNAAVSPESIISAFLKRVSNKIYNYIHALNSNNARQDYLIATLPSMRPIIEEAMLAQAVYMLQVGDLSLSDDPNERKLAMDTAAVDALSSVVPELKTSILQAGGIRRVL